MSQYNPSFAACQGLSGKWYNFKEICNMKAEGNKRPASVREELIQALTGLMAEKPYMEITVTDLVNKAGVARVSFYRNFGSVSDVLDAAAAELARDFTTEVLPVLTSGDERQWREFLFNFFYSAARDYKTSPPLTEQNRSVLFSRLGDLLAEQAPPSESLSIAEKYGPSAKMSLLMDVNSMWLEDGMQETPEEMVDWLMSFITKF